MKLLVIAGADVTVNDAEGLTALQLALQASHNNCAQYLQPLTATASSESEDMSSSSSDSESESELDSRPQSRTSVGEGGKPGE